VKSAGTVVLVHSDEEESHNLESGLRQSGFEVIVFPNIHAMRVGCLSEEAFKPQLIVFGQGCSGSECSSVVAFLKGKFGDIRHVSVRKGISGVEDFDRKVVLRPTLEDVLSVLPYKPVLVE
jgi:hypothetical protein